MTRSDTPPSATVALEQRASAHGAILYDPTAVEEVTETLFDPVVWRARGALVGLAGGRGTAHFIEDGGREWVLRHYRRGGLVGRWVHDSFLYVGAARTRSFRELRLLSSLHAQGLPVPRPVAAAFRRCGALYRADLITRRIHATPLSEWLARGAVAESLWLEIGRMVRRFHTAGAYHADLTAHNILLDAAGRPYLLDFDRGRERRPGRWCGRNLARLLRSLNKIRPQVRETRYPQPQWQWLLAGYHGSAT